MTFEYLLCISAIDLSVTDISASPTLQITRNYLTEVVFDLSTLHPGTLEALIARTGDLINFKALFILSDVEYTQGEDFMNENYTHTVMELAESQKGIGVGLSENIGNNYRDSRHLFLFRLLYISGA